MDFGYVTDPTTLVKVAVKDNNLYLKEYLYKQHLGTNEIIDLLTNIVDQDDLIVADNAEPRLISELQLAGFNVVPCKKGKDSIKNGIARMANYHFIVEGKNYVKELNNYVWNDRKSNTPIDKYNHLIDATRYAFDDLVQESNFIFI
jgi:phage terminase large subunit